MDIVILVGAFVVILLGAELFTNGIEWFGRKLELAEGAVGSVLAAVGTALPETMIPIIAILSGGPAFDLGRLVPDLAAFRPAGVIWLGLVLVVATPAARVGASLVGYARRGERAMAIVASLILLVIAVSVVLAKGLEG